MKLYENEEYIYHKIPIRVIRHSLEKEHIYSPLHWHRSIELDLSVKGRIIVVVNGARHEMQVGEWVLIRSGELHSFTFVERDDSYVGFTILIARPFLETWLGGEVDHLAYPKDAEGEQQITEILQKFVEIQERQEPMMEAEQMEYLFRLVKFLAKYCLDETIETNPKNSGDIENIKNVINYIDSHYTEPISLASVAEKFHYSQAHLSRLFKKHIGKTFYIDELRWLYMELYGNDAMFAELCDNLHRFAEERSAALKKRDLEREANPGWYRSNDLTGMMLYIDNFAGNLEGVQKKLSYIEQTGVNMLHLMPFLDTVPERSDGGYAVADFRAVRPDLGSMEDLEKLADACHKKGINLCMDFVMNHTSQDHEWAKKARQGDGEYMSRYFFFNNWSIPAEYEKTVPQVFPTTAPGNFTWLDDCQHFVMTSFYPYQWDLNYRNPRVFNEMMYNFLFLSNKGMDMIRIDAVPYIWKELGTNCRNLPQVHTIVRMMRMIGEIVCPSVILLGEVVMEPVKVVPYFGTVEKPECHLLYNVTTMCTTWHTVATQDTRLLRRQLDIVNSLPKEYVFLNYLRCHDDIGWGLDYGWLGWNFGINETVHKRFLSEWFQGHWEGSISRGELYNDDPASGDARQCGTTASLCGIEKAGFEKDSKAMERATRFDLTLHAMMFMQTGLPLLYSGDELAQVNDYSYKNDPRKAGDSRYLHRGKLRWDLAEHAHDLDTPEGQVFCGLNALGTLRKTNRAFGANADVWTLDTGDNGLLAIGRYYENQKVIGVFNFTPWDKTVSFPHDQGEFTDMLTGKSYILQDLTVPAYGFYYLQQVQI